ncbi:redox-sensitive transcriptional activator SoxR [Azospirillum sp. B4]|uniref:redox-sensitive transcriptional activator SoxR n=1 Tax=Azospirillum sp. B4 TaxID=95605 RepID=UPI0005C8733A|nr:redox-sensitive transcriptional activator SoxR [Azospirillum sp. B4]
MPGPVKVKRELSVGEVAKRAGVAVSTLHFYEAKGLITGNRSSGNQRRYPREILRRIAIIRVAQRAGISLADIRAALETVPEGRTPTQADWRRLSTNWRDSLQQRIDSLTQLRDQLESCIGCGCLSMAECPLRNPQDRLGADGPGPVLLQPVAKDGAMGEGDQPGGFKGA